MLVDRRLEAEARDGLVHQVVIEVIPFPLIVPTRALDDLWGC